MTLLVLSKVGNSPVVLDMVVTTEEKKSLTTVAISELLDVEVPFTLSSVIVDWTVFRLAASLSILQVFLGSLEWLARLDSK
jgi:hypothetical protein